MIVTVGGELRHAVHGRRVLTVSEVLKCKTLRKASVLAGEKGLENEIASVTVGEVPDIASWLRGGEMVLSTFFATSASEEERVHFVRAIIERGAGALLVKPTRFVGEIDPQIIEMANKKSFPLVEVPAEVRWTEIIKEIYERIVSVETEMRLKGDFVDDLISGQLESHGSLLSRARFLGFDASHGAQVVITDIDDFNEFVSKKSLAEQTIQRTKREFFDYVSQIAGSSHPHSLLSLKGDKIVLFLSPGLELAPEQLGEKAHKLAKGIIKGCEEHFEFTVSVGMGRFYPEPANLTKAYREAETALEISHKLGETRKVTTFDEIGVYKLLFNLARMDEQDLRVFCEETVSPLFSYDRRHKTDLVTTLDKYLKNNLNINKTAEDLFSHRHTIRYRLDRVTEITGLDPFKADELERLSLGLKAMRLLSKTKPEENGNSSASTRRS